MTERPAAIELHNLTLAHGEHPALHHLSGCFEAGSLTAVVGPNGAGKSSLLAALMGLLMPRTGCVRMPKELKGRVAYLPQQAEIDRAFPLQVLDVVMLGHWRRLGAFGAATGGHVEQALGAIRAVGLTGFEQRAVGELSAGQFQRVLFARLLLQDAPVILLDEPFNGIDQRTTADLLAVLKRWHEEARTVVAVLHDLEQVRAHFPQTLLLARESLAWGPTAEVLQPANLQRAGRMAEAWDDRAAWCERAPSTMGKSG
ncbi:metal ABC transporter ATP-binding protein [Caldimonas tepidiphila]|uniref:metal ABC transporter ATP-binding protein n=1 Tax=Caldimonas tepidiphila TaxID=2315841 RepID=UPI000E5AABEB|nr:metal ABC transporter ATP-binding protein [Caldimonas tepidiphila]